MGFGAKGGARAEVALEHDAGGAAGRGAAADPGIAAAAGEEVPGGGAEGEEDEDGQPEPGTIAPTGGPGRGGGCDFGFRFRGRNWLARFLSLRRLGDLARERLGLGGRGAVFVDFGCAFDPRPDRDGDGCAARDGDGGGDAGVG